MRPVVATRAGPSQSPCAPNAGTVNPVVHPGDYKRPATGWVKHPRPRRVPSRRDGGSSQRLVRSRRARTLDQRSGSALPKQSLCRLRRAGRRHSPPAGPGHWDFAPASNSSRGRPLNSLGVDGPIGEDVLELEVLGALVVRGNQRNLDRQQPLLIQDDLGLPERFLILLELGIGPEPSSISGSRSMSFIS